MKIILLKQLDDPRLPSGYKADVLSYAVKTAETYIEIENSSWDSLVAKYSKKPTVVIENRKNILPIGNIVEKVAKPIAKGIDKVAGTNVRNCAECKKRKELLNKVGEKITNFILGSPSGIK